MLHIAQYLTKQRQPDNKNLSVREYNRKTLFFKSHAENEAARLAPDVFLFLRKALYEVKASGLQLMFNIYINSPQLGIQ